MTSSNRTFKRLESRKSHSWWWDSHISPINNKWLADNLEEMDRSVKRMLKLIEEEGDSFAKKAEMYYQKRPQLISQVEEFYRMYRSLAERYDNLTGELRHELQTQSSGVSDAGSEIGSPRSVSGPARRSRRRSSHRAAGFDVFLGSGGGSPENSAEKEESGESSSSSSGSESDSDDGASSKNKYSGSPANGDGAGLSRRIIELEVELRDVKEKLRIAEEENSAALSKISENEELHGRITWYEEELNVTNEKLRRSEEEIARLKLEIEKTNESSEATSYMHTQLDSAWKDIEILANKKVEASEAEISRLKLELDKNKSSSEATHHLEVESPSAPNGIESRNIELGLESNGTADSEGDVLDQVSTIKGLEEELRVSSEKLRLSEAEIARLILELKGAKSSLKQVEFREIELQDRNKMLQGDVARLIPELEGAKSSLKHVESREVELQDQNKMLQVDVSSREQEIQELKAAISDAGAKFSLEKSKLETVVSGLSESSSQLERELKDWESRVQSLEEEIKRAEAEKTELRALLGTHEAGMTAEIERLKAEIGERGNKVDELNKSLDELKLKYDMLTAERDGLNAKVSLLVADVGSRDDRIERAEQDISERENKVEELNKNIDAHKLKYDMLTAERDELNAKVSSLVANVGSRDDRISQMEEHLHRLHLEHVELMTGCEVAMKQVEEQRRSLRDLEDEVERQRVVISDGAEEKREAIRQLCFSLEHYRNSYHQLRQAFLVHKRPASPVLIAS